MRRDGPAARRPAPLEPPALKVERLAVADLSADPANARKHDAVNQAAIVASLRRFGQQKPIVVDSSNVVRAGNGTLAAAATLGWTHIDVIRSDLAGSEMTAFAIADNRTSDLSEFDDPILAAQLESLRDEGVSLDDLGFTDKDLDKLLDAAGGDEGSGAGAGESAEKWMVVVTCRDEADQVAMLEQLQADGRECRVLLG